MNPVTEQILKNKSVGKKALAVLVDPDKINALDLTVSMSVEYEADFFFVGGSLITGSGLSQTVGFIKERTDIPVVLFPGNSLHIDARANALLFLSLISGRNPEFLIGQHVVAAPVLKRTSVEVIPVGYMLIDGGRQTSVGYISNTIPIPANKPEIAVSTAMAGEMLGLKLIYMDSGSGAEYPVGQKMISMVRKGTQCPILVGGGIRNVEQARISWLAGADIVVVGNALEKEPGLIPGLLSARNDLNAQIGVKLQS